MEIYDFTITGCEFHAVVPASEFSRDIVDTMNSIDDDDFEVFGEYFVQFDQGYPMVALEHCSVSHDGVILAANSYVHDYIRDTIQEHILKTWNLETKAMEYEASQFDYDDEVYND
jgi:hypothetical protein